MEGGEWSSRDSRILGEGVGKLERVFQTRGGERERESLFDDASSPSFVSDYEKGGKETRIGSEWENKLGFPTAKRTARFQRNEGEGEKGGEIGER